MPTADAVARARGKGLAAAVPRGVGGEAGGVEDHVAVEVGLEPRVDLGNEGPEANGVDGAGGAELIEDGGEGVHHRLLEGEDVERAHARHRGGDLPPSARVAPEDVGPAAAAAQRHDRRPIEEVLDPEGQRGGGRRGDCRAPTIQDRHQGRAGAQTCPMGADYARVGASARFRPGPDGIIKHARPTVVIYGKDG